MPFRMYLCPNGQKHIVRVTGRVRKEKPVYCSTDDFHVVDIATGQDGYVSGMFLRPTTPADWALKEQHS